jgi:hypothetical protein
VHHLYLKLFEKALVAILFMVEDDLQGLMMEEGLSECVFKGFVAEDGELIVQFGDQDVLLINRNELLSDDVRQILAEPVDALGPDHHVLLLDIPHYLLLDCHRVVYYLLSRELDDVEHLVDVE